ncbi:SOS response-associated peptidase [Phenylobacterium sp.]|uniref:SOS response-associated peptidase n=1 Tax=Phenylobacterium sp. TaxID=1871053 RepID=UPI0035B07A7E
MCNEYRFNGKLAEIAAEFSQLHIPLRFEGAASNRPPGEPLKPTNRATIIRPDDPENPRAGLYAADVRWWLVPFFHRKAVKDWRAMCTNARFETVDTAPTFRESYRKRRCLVPLTSFIEYSEPPGWKKGQPKTRHEITWRSGGVRYFAGIWERSNPEDFPEGLESFAFVTGPACADVEPIHDRTPSILTLEQGLEWLDLNGPGKEAFACTPPAGSYVLTVAPREAVMSREMRKLI